MIFKLEKIEKLLFYILVFAIPFSLKKVLWEWPQSDSTAGQMFSEWYAAVFYFTQGLLLLLLLVWIFNGGVARLREKPLAVFLLMAVFSVVVAANPILGFYRWLVLGVMVLFFIYLRERFSRHFYDLNRVLVVFITSAVFQSFVAIAQSLLQTSLRSLPQTGWGSKLLALVFKWLGESVVSPGAPNVAQFVSQGTRVLRAYGTLPHPNVLAAFLVTAIFFLLYLYLKSRKIRWVFIWLPVYFILLFALFLTFSRGIILIFIFTLLCWCCWLFYKVKEARPKVFYALLILVVFYSLLAGIFYRKEFSSRYRFSQKEEAVSMRLFYDEAALKMMVRYPILGAGIGNFVLRMDEVLSPSMLQRYDLKEPLNPLFYQPAHNIFLLAGAESGIGALLALSWFAISIVTRGFRHRKEYYLGGFLFSGFLLFGMFDHFFLTLPPAMLIFWLVSAIISADGF